MVVTALNVLRAVQKFMPTFLGLLTDFSAVNAPQKLCRATLKCMLVPPVVRTFLFISCTTSQNMYRTTFS
jgi:hypothetical protein